MKARHTPRRTLLHTLAMAAGGLVVGALPLRRGQAQQQQPQQPLRPLTPLTPLTIAAASDLRFALDELLQPFRAAWPGLSVQVIYGASGRLAAQIRQGAPFDVFLSADLSFAQGLFDAGLTTGPPRRYALGALVSWSTDAALGHLALAELVRAPQVQRLAIANPQHAPYGQRAVQALRSQGLLQAAQPKLVLGDNVAQATQFVESGAAQAGLVAHALVLAPQLQGRGAFTVLPAAWHAPLEQAGVITRRAAEHPAASAFMAHLETPASRALLRRYGFALPP